VFTALAVARETQDRTGLAIRNVIRRLRPLRSATIAVNGTVQAFPPAIGPEQQKILDDLRTVRFPSNRGDFLIADSCNFAASSEYRTPVHFVS